MRVLAGLLVALCITAQANAAIIEFDLQGRSGSGLLGDNENPGAAGGSGGEIGAGIFLDDVTNILTLNTGWGSGNGFTDLTGAAAAIHIHGVAAGPNPFTSNGGVLHNLGGLPGFDDSATNGGLTGTVNLSAGDVTDLMAGRLYLNVHTAANGGGEIRGNLVSAVPEPGSLGLAAILGLASFIRRRRA